MGIYLFSHGVNFGKLRQVFASKDERLFRAILRTKTFVDYAAQDSAGDVTQEEAIRHIIYGEQYSEESAHSYGYALIRICDAMGVNLSGDSDVKIPYVTDLIDEYLVADFGVEEMDCYFDL